MDKQRHRRHRAHDDQTAAALSDRMLGPDAEERQAKRLVNSRRVRIARNKAARKAGE